MTLSCSCIFSCILSFLSKCIVALKGAPSQSPQHQSEAPFLIKALCLGIAAVAGPRTIPQCSGFLSHRPPGSLLSLLDSVGVARALDGWNAHRWPGSSFQVEAFIDWASLPGWPCSLSRIRNHDIKQSPQIAKMKHTHSHNQKSIIVVLATKVVGLFIIVAIPNVS